MKNKLCFLAVVMFLLTLTGCSDLVEIQDRDFVLALGVSCFDDQYKLTYALPDLSSLTETGDDENIRLVRSYQANSLPEIEDLYDFNTSKRLDYRHLSVVVLDASIGEQPGLLQELFEYMVEHHEISPNVLIFYYDGDAEELLDTKGDLEGSIGDYIRNLENNSRSKYRLPIVTAGNLMDGLSQGQAMVVPQLEMNEDQPEIRSVAVFSNYVYQTTLDEDQRNIYYLTIGEGQNYTLHYRDDQVFRVKSVKSQTEYSFENDQPVIRYKITGSIELLNSQDENEDMENEINEYLQNVIAEQMAEHVKQEYLDYFHLYEKSGLKSRSMWVQYNGRTEEFLDDVEIRIRVDLGIE